MRFCHLLVTILPTLTLATDLSFHIPPSSPLPNPSSLPPSTTATLTTLSQAHTALLSVDNTFSFRNVSAGSYLFSVQCTTHAFHPLRVDVGEDGVVEAWRTFPGHEWDNKGEQMRTGQGNAIDVKAVGGKEYYMQRQGFSPLSILKSPMILIALFSMVMVFGMPYLMDNLDPETRAELEERQKSSPVSGLLAGQQPGANPTLGNFDAAAWLAGAGKKTEASGEKRVSR